MPATVVDTVATAIRLGMSETMLSSPLSFLMTFLARPHHCIPPSSAAPTGQPAPPHGPLGRVGLSPRGTLSVAAKVRRVHRRTGEDIDDPALNTGPTAVPKTSSSPRGSLRRNVDHPKAQNQSRNRIPIFAGPSTRAAAKH